MKVRDAVVAGEAAGIRSAEAQEMMPSWPSCEHPTGGTNRGDVAIAEGDPFYRELILVMIHSIVFYETGLLTACYV